MDLWNKLKSFCIAHAHMENNLLIGKDGFHVEKRILMMMKCKQLLYLGVLLIRFEILNQKHLPADPSSYSMVGMTTKDLVAWQTTCPRRTFHFSLEESVRYGSTQGCISAGCYVTFSIVCQLLSHIKVKLRKPLQNPYKSSQNPHKVVYGRKTTAGLGYQ